MIAVLQYVLRMIIRRNSRRNSNVRQEHGGTFSLGRKRVARPLSTKHPLHLVMKSDFAYGPRNLMKHQTLIERVLRKAAVLFNIKVYQFAVAYNHVHIVIRGFKRVELQNFFRVLAGHSAQEILDLAPIQSHEKPRPSQLTGKTRENENKFWQTRIYSRLMTWGREFFIVLRYVLRNTLEALGAIPYAPRKKYNENLPENLKMNNSS